MHDLKTQLGDYFEHAVQRLDVEDILEDRAGPGPSGEPHQLVFVPLDGDASSVNGPRPADDTLQVGPKHRVGVLAAVAAIVLLVVGLLVVAGGGDDVVTTDPAATPTPADTGPSPSVTAPASGERWARIAHDEAVMGGPGVQSMVDVTAGGPGLVAVGAEGSDEAGDAAVWTSVDGITWLRVPDEAGVLGGPGDQTMWGVTAGGPGLVAVGRVGADLNSDGDAAVWTSVDGITWLRVPDEAGVLGGPGDQVMFSVVAGGPGLVAVGIDRLEAEMDAAVWTSVDGITWLRAPDEAGVLGGTGTQVLWDVVAGGPGLVAVGWGNPGSDVDAVVWTSADGISWLRASDEAGVLGGPGSQVLRGVVAGGPGLVAVGAEDSGSNNDAAVWTSVDGISWLRAEDGGELFGGVGNQELWQVTTATAGLVAVGRDNSSGDNDAAVWTSVDGVSWSRVQDDEMVFGGPGRQVMNGVVAGGPGVVAVGNDGEDEADGVIWVVASQG